MGMFDSLIEALAKPREETEEERKKRLARQAQTSKLNPYQNRNNMIDKIVADAQK